MKNIVLGRVRVRQVRVRRFGVSGSGLDLGALSDICFTLSDGPPLAKAKTVLSRISESTA